jgi:hypothetical protein
MASDSFTPPAAKNLIPLSPNGLCEAEITAPGTWRSAHTHAMVGVGTHTEDLDGGPAGGEAARQRGLDPRARHTGVAADDEAGSGHTGSQNGSRGAPERRNQHIGELVGRGRERRRFRSAGTWPPRLSLGVLRRLAGLLEAVLLASFSRDRG